MGSTPFKQEQLLHEEADPEVLLYIDNSNVFLEAQKVAGREKGYINGIPEVNCRIEIGKLLEMVVGSRKVLYAKLYGSTPSPVDSVWKAFERQKVDVQTFQRSTWTLKEKETDSTLTADAVEDIIIERDSLGPNKTVILLTGDKDLSSIAKKANKYGYVVEIWSFKQALNDSWKRKAARDPANIRVNYIDDIFPQVTFTEFLWGDRKFPRERTLVTPIELPTNQDKKKFLSEFVAKSAEIFRLPMMGKYLHEYKHIVVVPCIREHYTPKPSHGRTKSDMVAFRTRSYDYYRDVLSCKFMLEEHYLKLGEPITIKLQSWKEFLARQNRRHPASESLISENRFQESLAISDNFNGDEDEDDDDDAGNADFVVYVRKEAKPKTRRNGERCPYEFWCKWGKNCYFEHASEEMEYFEVRPDRKKRGFYKTILCHYPVCKYQEKTYKCGFAHNLGESRCLCCKGEEEGLGKHWMHECPMNTKFNNI